MVSPKDDKGQVLSSLVAVLAVVAVVGGLLVLFGTRGGDDAADQPDKGNPTPGTKSTVPAGMPSAQPTVTATKPTAQSPTTPAPSRQPTSAPPPATTKPSEQPTTEPPSTEQPSTGQPTQPPKTLRPVERPAIEVYNNTNRKGLADSVANRARQAGWTVSGRPDNWHGKVVSSTVYYPAGMEAAAGQLARDLGITRLKDALDNMKKDRLTVILTTDYQG